ncbi:MAG: DNA-3-methyladenine glycosylase 2 family protein [Anaerolineae bacterium]
MAGGLSLSGRPEDGRLLLRPVPPFDLAQSLAFLKGFPPLAGDQAFEANRLVSGGYAQGRPFLARVHQGVAGESLPVEIEWLRGPGSPEVVGQWLTRYLSLDDDLKPFYRIARGDPVLAPIVEDLYGYHHVRFPTPFEAACWAALSQRTPWQVARGLKQKLVEVAGEVVFADDARIALFPSPERILSNRLAVEQAIGHRRKARTLLAAAEAFLAGDLYELDDEDLADRLQAIWGFGAWSSEFILLRGFGRLDRIPTSERRLRKAVARLYGLDKPEASEEDLHRLGGRYGDQVGYWAHYIRGWADRTAAFF